MPLTPLHQEGIFLVSAWPETVFRVHIFSVVTPLLSRSRSFLGNSPPNCTDGTVSKLQVPQLGNFNVTSQPQQVLYLAGSGVGPTAIS